MVTQGGAILAVSVATLVVTRKVQRATDGKLGRHRLTCLALRVLIVHKSTPCLQLVRGHLAPQLPVVVNETAVVAHHEASATLFNTACFAAMRA